MGLRTPAGSSAIVQFSVPPPVLATVSCWLVVVLAACVLVRLAGVTLMLGACCSPWQAVTSTLSTCHHQS